MATCTATTRITWSPADLQEWMTRMGFITQQDAAEALGVSRMLVSLMLSGQRTITSRTAKIAALLEQQRQVMATAA